MSIVQTSWEIWAVANGKLGMFAIDHGLPSLERAREAAEYAARGDLLDNRGNRKPPKEIFELEDGETLADAMKPGLYIFKKVVKTEPVMHF